MTKRNTCLASAAFAITLLAILGLGIARANATTLSELLTPVDPLLDFATASSLIQGTSKVGVYDKLSNLLGHHGLNVERLSNAKRTTLKVVAGTEMSSLDAKSLDLSGKNFPRAVRLIRAMKIS